MTIYTGTDNKDTLNGAVTDDSIYGNGGNDILNGNAGNDYLQGDAGSDTYLIDKNEGQDTINNYDTDGSIDIVKFSNVASTDIKAVFDTGYSLVLQYGVSSQLTVSYYFYTNVNYWVDKFVFSDGKTWSFAQIAGKHNGTNLGETMYGFNGVVNVINGLGGNDTIYAGDLNDTLDGGEGGDLIYAYAGNDKLTGGVGDDNLQAGTGNDILTGGDGNDTMVGDTGIDSLVGGNDNDTMYGGTEADTLNGGLGNDYMQGDSGNDIYLIAKADGQDTINNYDTDGSVDIVKFSNVASTDIKAVFDTGNSLVLQYGTSSQLTVSYYFYPNANYWVDKFQFSDGKTWSFAQIAGKHNGTNLGEGMYGFNGVVNVINGLGGNDTIYAGDLNDTLDGGEGGDLIYAYAGNDKLTGGVGDDNLQSGIGNDILTGGDGNDTMVADTGIDSLVGGNDNDTMYGGADADTLNGGLGNDYMQGDAGNDIYLIAKADGQDTINNYDTDGSIDIVKFSNVASTDIKAVFDTGNSLVLQYGTSSQLTVSYYFYPNASYWIDKFQFSDGKTWSFAQIAGKHNGTNLGEGMYGFNGVVNVINGLGGNDTIYAGDLNDTLDGGEGGDLIYAYAGDDKLTGGLGDDNLQSGIGNDTLSGGDGNDTMVADTGIDSLVGGNDNDSMYGGADADTLNGGLGNDYMQGDAGNDTYLFAKADGQDTLNNYDTDNSLDIVKFSDVKSTDIKGVYDTGYALVLQYGVNSQLTVSYYFYPDVNYRIDKFLFSDGKTWTLADIANKHNGTNLGEVMYGFDGVVNVINGLAGNDTIYAGSLNDTVDGGEGSDSIVGYAGNDSLTGGLGDDNIDGGLGNDTINAGDGSDTLVGGGGNDILTGGFGNDSMQGNDGTDTYFIAKADGQDIIYNYDVDVSVDIIKFTDVSLLDLTGISMSGSSLIIAYGLAGNQVTISNHYLGAAYQINEVQLEGGERFKNFVIGTTADETLTGTAGADIFSGVSGKDTLKGGSGDDLYFVDDTAVKIVEGLGTGVDQVIASVSYTLFDNVDNLSLNPGGISGTGNSLDNILMGNNSTNTLSGMEGNDLLDGGARGDTMIGGTGNDTYIVDNIDDKIVENASQGNDAVQSSVSYTLANNVETLVLLKTTAINGTGNASDNRITGNAGVNILDGAAGNDRLDGDAGADTLKGGDGDDTYLIDSSDTIQENANAGTDTVQADFTYTLGANVENLILTGTGAINGTGNALVNSLTGNNGNNALNGGAGADTLIGKGGSDAYFVDDAGDVVQELVNEGIDTVNSAINYTLGDNLEKLTLTGTAAKGTGNALVNTLKGNASNNTLNGGAEADAMEGGAGNDTYMVDNIGDAIVEALNEGTDSVISAVSYSLADNIENLTLTGAALKGTGNNLANTLVGNANSNTLNGGFGVDTMKGGAGNDTYVVNISTDIVEETLDEGTDLVSSTATYILTDNIENLTLAGSSAIDGTGNGLDNILIGNAGNNKLDGLAGIDTLTGGDGSDVFVFSTLTGGTDTALDMVSGTDKLQLSGDFNFGNGDNFIDGGVLLDAGGTFSSGAELVIVKPDIIGAIDRVAAATAIGSADATYAIGDTRLFVVDNNADSILYQFTAANADATVDANELILVGTLQGTAQTALADYLFA